MTHRGSLSARKVTGVCGWGWLACEKVGSRELGMGGKETLRGESPEKKGESSRQQCSARAYTEPEKLL